MTDQFNFELIQETHPGSNFAEPSDNFASYKGYQNSAFKIQLKVPNALDKQAGELNSPSRQAMDELVFTDPVDESSKEQFEIGRSKSEIENQTYNSSLGKVELERERLFDSAKKVGLDPESFRRSIDRFEQRQKKWSDLIPQSEVSTTYSQVSRLLESKIRTPLDQSSINKLADQILRQAAEPNTIDQGNHKTCNVCTVEERTYFRQPSEAARLVVDIAINGEYKSKGGVKTSVTPLACDLESVYCTLNSSYRTHASEIFQRTAVNLHLSQVNAATGKKLKYEQDAPSSTNSTGEVLRDYSVNPPLEIAQAPNLNDSEIANIGNIISGRNESKAFVVSEEFSSGETKELSTFKTEFELNKLLQELWNKKQFPLIFVVHTGNEPFYTDSGAGRAGGFGGGHVVTLHDYKGGPNPTVKVDNQWGESNDHMKDSQALTVHQLFIAGHSPSTASKIIQKDIDADRKKGTVSLKDELNLIRLKLIGRDFSDTKQIERDLVDIMRKTKQTWELEQRSGNIEEFNKAEIDLKIERNISRLGEAGKIRMRFEQYKMGDISAEKIDDMLTEYGAFACYAIKYGLPELVTVYSKLLRTLPEDRAKIVKKRVDSELAELQT